MGYLFGSPFEVPKILADMCSLRLQQDLEEVEEWNEYGETKMRLASPGSKPTATASSKPSTGPASSVGTSPKDSPVQSVVETLSPEKEIPSSPLSQPPSATKTTSAPSLKKEETPLTMAMKQAGAEAAKKAGERGGSTTTAKVPPSVAGGRSSDVPMPSSIDSDSGSDNGGGRKELVEDPEQKPELTVGKIPEKLAEDGAERTSIGKIAEEEARRDEQGTGIDTNAEGNTGTINNEVFPETATRSRARAQSNAPKTKSPLADETGTTSMADLEAEADNSNNNKEDVKSAETENNPVRASIEDTTKKDEKPTIPTAPEKEEREDKERAEANDKEKDETGRTMSNPQQANPIPTENKLQSSPTVAKTNSTTEVTASDAEELAVTDGVAPQETDAKDARGAGMSVGD